MACPVQPGHAPLGERRLAGIRHPDLGGAPDIIGATYADAGGAFYGSYSGTGRIYRIAINPTTHTGTGVFFADGPTSVANDGARCAQSPLDVDYGDAPNSYHTTFAAGGARNGIPDYNALDHTAPLMLGTHIDPDPDGTPSLASGDDTSAIDDEDGVAGPIVYTPGQPITVTVTVTNNTAQPATLGGWVDRNVNDGVFGIGGGESASTVVPANSGTAQYTLTFSTNAAAVWNSYARFRVFPGALSVAQVQEMPTGASSAGETEDYVMVTPPSVSLTCSTDTALLNTGYNSATGGPLASGTDPRWSVGVGDATGPQSVPGWAPATIVSSPNALWAVPPQNNSNWISYNATGAQPATQDVYYRYTFSVDPSVLLSSLALPMDFYVDNMLMEVWVNGVPQSPTTTGLPSYGGPNPYQLGGNFGTGNAAHVTLAGSFQHGVNQMILRVASAPAAVGVMAVIRPTSVCPRDFGDAPATFGTTLAGNGARHVIPNYDPATHTAPLMLGTTIDAETDGTPTPDAAGDDTTVVDDEAGVGQPILWEGGAAIGVTVTVTNTTSEPATLAGWLDGVTNPGVFDPSERQSISIPANSGTATYSLTFPANTRNADTVARFRVFPGVVADPSPLGSAAAGEVEEDYPVTKRPAPPRAVLQVQKVGEDSSAQIVPMDGSAWAVYGVATGGTALVDPIAPVTAGGSSVTGLFRDVTLTAGARRRVPFSVAADGTVTLGAAPPNVAFVDLDGTGTIRVTDVPKIDLPEAGGSGTTPVYVAGLTTLVVAAALASLTVIRRRTSSPHRRGRQPCTPQLR